MKVSIIAILVALYVATATTRSHDVQHLLRQSAYSTDSCSLELIWPLPDDVVLLTPDSRQIQVFLKLRGNCSEFLRPVLPTRNHLHFAVVAYDTFLARDDPIVHFAPMMATPFSSGDPCPAAVMASPLIMALLSDDQTPPDERTWDTFGRHNKEFSIWAVEMMYSANMLNTLGVHAPDSISMVFEFHLISNLSTPVSSVRQLESATIKFSSLGYPASHFHSISARYTALPGFNCLSACGKLCTLTKSKRDDSKHSSQSPVCTLIKELPLLTLSGPNFRLLRDFSTPELSNSTKMNACVHDDSQPCKLVIATIGRGAPWPEVSVVGAGRHRLLSIIAAVMDDTVGFIFLKTVQSHIHYSNVIKTIIKFDLTSSYAFIAFSHRRFNMFKSENVYDDPSDAAFPFASSEFGSIHDGILLSRAAALIILNAAVDEVSLHFKDTIPAPCSENIIFSDFWLCYCASSLLIPAMNIRFRSDSPISVNDDIACTSESSLYGKLVLLYEQHRLSGVGSSHPPFTERTTLGFRYFMQTLAFHLVSSPQIIVIPDNEENSEFFFWDACCGQLLLNYMLFDEPLAFDTTLHPILLRSWSALSVASNRHSFVSVLRSAFISEVFGWQAVNSSMNPARRRLRMSVSAMRVLGCSLENNDSFRRAADDLLMGSFHSTQNDSKAHSIHIISPVSVHSKLFKPVSRKLYLATHSEWSNIFGYNPLFNKDVSLSFSAPEFSVHDLFVLCTIAIMSSQSIYPPSFNQNSREKFACDAFANAVWMRTYSAGMPRCFDLSSHEWSETHLSGASKSHREYVNRCRGYGGEDQTLNDDPWELRDLADAFQELLILRWDLMQSWFEASIHLHSESIMRADEFVESLQWNLCRSSVASVSALVEGGVLDAAYFRSLVATIHDPLKKLQILAIPGPFNYDIGFQFAVNHLSSFPVMITSGDFLLGDDQRWRNFSQIVAGLHSDIHSPKRLLLSSIELDASHDSCSSEYLISPCHQAHIYLASKEHHSVQSFLSQQNTTDSGSSMKYPGSCFDLPLFHNHVFNQNFRSSSEFLPLGLSRHTIPGTTSVFSLSSDSLHPPTCSTLIHALSTSPFLLQASYPSPSIVPAMLECERSSVINQLELEDNWPLSMNTHYWETYDHQSSLLNISILNSSSSSLSDPFMFYTVLGVSNVRSSTCSDLLKAIKSRHSSFIFLLSSENTFSFSDEFSHSSSVQSCFSRRNLFTLRHAFSLIHMFLKLSLPSLLFPLLQCWVTSDLLEHICSLDSTRSILVLALPSAFFREIPPLYSNAYYTFPSLPSPLRWTPSDSDLLSDRLPRSFGSVPMFSLHTLVDPHISFFLRKDLGLEGSPLSLSISLHLCSSSSEAYKATVFDESDQSDVIRPVCALSAACTCPSPLQFITGLCLSSRPEIFSEAFNCINSSCTLSPFLEDLKKIPDSDLTQYMSRVLSKSVFAFAFAASLQDSSLTTRRHVLDIGCGGGCWSLRLAGPSLHVTVVVSFREALTQALRIVNALDLGAHATVLLCNDLNSAEGFLSVLDDSVLFQDDSFMGFEFVIILDVLSRLPPVLLYDLSAALRPYVHTRSKAIVSLLGLSAKLPSSEWYEPDRLEVAMAPLNASVLWCGVAGLKLTFNSTESVNVHRQGHHDCIDDADCMSYLALQGQEFHCSGCSIIEVLISGSRRMTSEGPVDSLRWKANDFVSVSCVRGSPLDACVSNKTVSSVTEFATRRSLMRMLQQEDHEVFSSLSDWSSVPFGYFSPGWSFSETFDGRLLLLPFFHRAHFDADSPHDITLVLHMDSSRLSNLDLIVRSWAGPVSVVVLVYAANFNITLHSITMHVQSSHAVSKYASIHLARFSRSPEHYSVNALRNVAAYFSSTLWVITLDADFVPSVESRSILLSAVRSHGYDDDGRQLKRAFITPPFSSQVTFSSPLNFSFISANLGDDVLHSINSWPEVPVNPWDERQYQCHANIDIQRWLMISLNSSSDGSGSSPLVYKIPYSYGMEPYYVVPSHSFNAVMYDERFRRWGGDKQSHAFELASKSYEFFVVALAGVVHQPHERFNSWSQDDAISYPFGVYTVFAAKEDSLLLPPELIHDSYRLCDDTRRYSRDGSDILGLLHYHERLSYLFAKIESCRRLYQPYFLKHVMPRQPGNWPGFYCGSMMTCDDNL